MRLLHYALLSVVIFSFAGTSFAQQMSRKQQWVDSMFSTLSTEEKITQLMVIRTSSMDGQGNQIFFDDKTDEAVKKFNVGAVCLFQGMPQQQAALLNRIQGMAKTPIMVTVDGEWGLGMRFGGVQSFPYQLTMGALPDAELVYRIGRAIADQCRRMNIHVNFSPVVDVNNNPANPVIGVRSFGEDKYKVALMGTRIMQGMQDAGIMACAKHFPGHGDVSVDSHYDLPVIGKSRTQLDSLELYPFREVFQNGIGSVMVAHLYIPAIDTTANRATSLSPNNITQLMRNELGYQGLTFTDALEMKGVAKFFPAGEASVQSLIAGNDMICLPGDVALALEAIQAAIAAGRLSQQAVDAKCRRVLEAKYDYVNGRTRPVEVMNLTTDLNASVATLRREVAEQALTVLRRDSAWRHFGKTGKSKPDHAYVLVGSNPVNNLLKLMKKQGVTTYYLPLNATASSADSLWKRINAGRHKRLVVGLHNLGRGPANNFGLGADAAAFVNKLGEKPQSSLLIFGNPYALLNVAEQSFSTLTVCYEDDSVFQAVAYDWLLARFKAVGTLPVTVGPYTYDSGLSDVGGLAVAQPRTLGMKPEALEAIDTIAAEGISKGAFPGCVVTVLRKGKLVFQKAYGHYSYDKAIPMTPRTIFDLASVTKISATTVAAMKLYEEGKLDLKKKASDYVPWLRGTDKEAITIENLLLHQAGLVSFIPFYRETLDATGTPSSAIFTKYKKPPYLVDVTDALFMRPDWQDTMRSRIISSTVNTKELKLVYSDNDFIILGNVVEAITGKGLHQYAQDAFYKPLGMATTGFRPYEHFSNSQIAPTEKEKQFRQGLLWGYTHDPGAAMFGNVAGHAGLFSNANDLAKLYQMLLNGGEYNGKRYLKKETIDWFTSYQTPISHRGLGFDKPYKDNDRRPVDRAYPSKSVSHHTFGHTGYTGTCVWVDPKEELIYIFLSNRVHPYGGDNTKLSTLNIRPRIQEAIYASLRK
jgi:beta-glucosidase-like glycosyl hydrolase/CubicO group peptidase (beta-lactamase class C family)